MRGRATVFTSIWHDEDWQRLPLRAQWLYFFLLSQPGLSLAGVIDLNPTRWARRAADATADDVEAALTALEAAQFVVVDRAVEEVMIRTFTVHDLRAGRLSGQLSKGFWKAWLAIESDMLRDRVVRSIPEVTWLKLAVLAPPIALETRRSAPIEPQVEPPLDWEDDFPIEPQGDLPIDCPLPLPLPLPLPPPDPCADVRAGTRAAEPLQAILVSAPKLDRQQRAEAACVELGDINHDTAKGEGAVRSPDSHRAACRRSARTEHLQDAQQLAHKHPDWTPSEIAAEIGSPAVTWSPPRPTEPQPKSLYERQERLRRQRLAEGPAHRPDSEVLSAGVHQVRLSLEAARATAAAEAEASAESEQEIHA